MLYVNKENFLSSFYDFLTSENQEVLKYNRKIQKDLLKIPSYVPLESFCAITISTTFKLFSKLGILQEEELSYISI